MTRNQGKRLLDNRSVFVNRRRIWMAKHKVSRDDIIEIHGANTPKTRQPLSILSQNDQFIVINKPAGILSNEARDSAEQQLREQVANHDIKAVHRLDKDTSGCLVMAFSEDAFTQAVSLFREHAVQKHYLCILNGKMTKPQTVNVSIDKKSATTTFTPLSWTDEMTLVRAQIETGRTHQIRKHAVRIGHPLLGDRQYGKKQIENAAIRAVPRQMLHAWKLECAELSIHATAPLPGDFSTALKRFGLKFAGTPP